MTNIVSIANFIGIFLGLCLFIVIVICMLNIYTKSYRPARSIFILVTLIVLFFVCGFLTISSLNSTVTQINEGESTDINLPSAPETNLF